MKKYITEFIGTFFLVLTIGLAVNGGVGIMAPLVIGSSLMIMIYAGGHISGGHYNPAVTLAVFIRGRITSDEVLKYMISQVAAAIFAALAVKCLDSGIMPHDAATNPNVLKALLAELLGTFALAYVVLNVATAKANAGNSYFGLAIGFTVMVMVYILGPFSGGAFNPAVAIGISIMKMAAWQDIWIYIVGCFGGAAIAAIVFKINNPEDN
jgi:aquaporin Z